MLHHDKEVPTHLSSLSLTLSKSGFSRVRARGGRELVICLVLGVPVKNMNPRPPSKKKEQAILVRAGGRLIS